MTFSVGIGIITYNRREILKATIDRLRSSTRHPDAALVVADDGSGDGTLAMLRDEHIPVITGVNMGIAWNKNRALFLLAQMLGCETVILLEDDTRPDRDGWETPWIQGARRWGHVNLAGDWMQEHFLSGAGTPDDPVRSRLVTAQCAAYSWTALTYGGYFDPRFTGYGHEHVDHSRRLIRLGFGGSDTSVDGQEQVLFHLLKGGVTIVSCQSHFDAAQAQQNLLVAQQTTAQQEYRAPWRTDSQMRQFRAETESALSEGVERFRLTPAEASGTPPRGVVRGSFGRLFRWS